ncbi:hypothetical protein ABT263_25335 [Kitasatospora sp. NPDC001603]|uniref:hypothetical protein n=1 Tax=Kitasatospora sp. NPDC001603 TaxID=3154388 RepID=UPI003327A8FF
MQQTLATMFLAVVTTVFTTLVMSRVTPRTERWGGRYKRAQAGRDALRTALETILVASGRLAVERRADGTGYADRLAGEWDRWRGQLDSATCTLIDGGEFALTYSHRQRIQEQLSGFIVLVRAVWLCDRPETERLRLVRELTEPAYQVFFPSRLHPLRFAAARERLDAALGTAQTAVALDVPTSEPAID